MKKLCLLTAFDRLHFSAFLKNIVGSLLCLLCCSDNSYAQILKDYSGSYNVDSLKKTLATNINDSTRANTLFHLGLLYLEYNLDSSLKYIKQLNEFSSKTNQMNGLVLMGDIYLRMGNASKSLEALMNALEIEDTIKDPTGTGMLYWNLGKVYESQNDKAKAISYYVRAINKGSANGVHPKAFALASLGALYLNLNQLDSALYFTQLYFKTSKQLGETATQPFYLLQLGNIYLKLGDGKLARKYYNTAIQEALPFNSFEVLSESYIGIATLLKEKDEIDSSYYYAHQAFVLAKQLNNVPTILKASTFLKDFYKKRNAIDSAFKYQEIMMVAKDSLLSLERSKRVQTISFQEQQRKQELAAQKKAYQTELKLYVLLSSVAVFLFLAIYLFRVNRQKQKAAAKIEKAYSDLKTTQAQLIQSEKMASLGELTAGIAHEIQNPLNFVNNFSDVNQELLEELKEEAAKGNIEEVKIIANDVIENSEKINQHGKRADAIVKGMLLHSRTSTGQKESTDINKLCDEYVRLAYHGFKAKDKSFQAEIKTDFDESIDKISIVPQDIGRVLLNLLNNAFYAVNEKKKANEKYAPIIWISTKNSGDKIEILIQDNGTGIPEKIADKIFQPFYTTKPTGQGTGLGLSLSYDIVKAHGGDIKVISEEGEGSTFIIEIPNNS